MGACARTVTAARAVTVAALAAVAAVVMVPTMHEARAAAGAREGVRGCMSVTPDDARLACYDREVRNLVEPTFAGRLSKTTDRFHVDGPTLLRFQSDGPIFVLYLKNAEDNAVIQNLHIGGGGEDTYLIERTGTYFLDVSGSESWRIWVEPLRDSKTN